MSIPRHALIPSITPRTGRLPLGAGLWWPLHGSFAGMPDTPTLVEVTAGTGASGSKWSADALMYSFPTDNSDAANGAALKAPHDEDDDSLEQVLGLIGAATDTHVLVACTARWGDQQTVAGNLWCYGLNSANASMLSLVLTTGELPSFSYRGKDASAQTTLTVGSGLTAGAGTALSDTNWRGNDVQCVFGLRVTSATTADLELRFGDGTRAISYTGACNWADNGGTAPGRGTSPASAHPGLMVACRASSGPVYDQYLGRGAGHSARIGNVCARRFSAWSSGRAAQAVADLLARPDDYPASWLL